MSEHAVLVTSDTHVLDASRLPDALLTLAQRADHIVHAGDLCSADVIDVLSACAPLTAVCGNVDGMDVAARLEDRAFASIGGRQVGVLHDAGEATGRHKRLESMLPDCSIRIYGHTHLPEITWLDDGSLIINPGSPVQRRRAPFHSCVWLTIGPDAVTADLINLDV